MLLSLLARHVPEVAGRAIDHLHPGDNLDNVAAMLAFKLVRDSSSVGVARN
jgi:hypothetical protein